MGIGLWSGDIRNCRFAEIISAVYNVEVSPDYQTVIIPVRTEYDENGKPVHSLDGVSFEEALDKYREFVEQNGHLPFATSGEYECSLRRWQQEINHDIRPLTHTQYKEFEELMASYADVPRTRYDRGKRSENDRDGGKEAGRTDPELHALVRCRNC